MSAAPKRKPLVEIGPIHIFPEFIDYGINNSQGTRAKTRKSRRHDERRTGKQGRKK
jgi:hypothetical protein